MNPQDLSGQPAAEEPASDPTAGQDPLQLLQALKALWPTREWLQLREEAWRGFAALNDPRAGLLDMLAGTDSWRGKGSSLEAWLICELQRWLQAQPSPWPAQGDLGLKQLQDRAIRVLAESPSSLVEPLTSIFQLQDQDRGPLLAHVHSLHQEGRFKEALMLGMKLKLQPELDVEEMSTPLLLQDKLNLVECYVAGFPDLQKRLLTLMDSWCQPGFNINAIANDPGVSSAFRVASSKPFSTEGSEVSWESKQGDGDGV